MSVVEEGQLKGSFRGFHNRDTVFEFYGGHKWRQQNYHYHYAYMPHARIVEEDGGYSLEVDGIDDRIHVVRAR